MFTVYDSKVEAHLPPVLFQTKAEFLRVIGSNINDPNSQIGKYPEDFTLFEIGTWDEQKGVVTMHKSSISLGKAIEYVTPKEN